ncbi:TPA: hypothetical protein G8O67_004777 [Salmonella enterica]|uniref:Uncharacterized protein n=1 Tax=Salmonella enterica TaxID=28901 RepID=A0A756I304_SALER|nr:hypothetical protein [Salmonella enterica]
MSDLHGLHITIAEWILNHGKAVSAYDVSEQFGLTLNQTTAIMTILEKDRAIKTRRGKTVPSRASGRYGIRTVKVTAIDHEKMEKRKKKSAYSPPETIRHLSRRAKWARLLHNAWRDKK